MRACIVCGGSKILARFTAFYFFRLRAIEEKKHVVYVALVGDSRIGNWNYGF
jgi:hypothetical protein